MSTNKDGEQILYDDMRSMITLVDKLRDFNLEEYIALPRIAVLGEQSSGKSSLLESICGMNFLPRGSGVVTRRPLELRMVRSAIEKPYFTFPKDFGDKKFEDQDLVKSTIESLTDKGAGSDKAISEDPIICSVYSSVVPDLTLVDLPGITRNPIGNQPKNIEEITKGLVKKYCQESNTLILCVIPANIDLSTSDSLKFAQELDPEGNRTLGVLTKVDLMDEGTDALKVLTNKEIPLKHGYVAVKGRSQKDILGKMGVQDAIRRELDFFGSHTLYSTLPSELLGTRSLIDRSSKILYQLIRTFLPVIQTEILERKKKAKDSLAVLGEEIPDTDEKKLELVFKLVRGFKDNLDKEIHGKYSSDAIEGKTKETVIFQIGRLFSDLLEDFAAKDYQVTYDYSDEKIQRAIDIYQGDFILGFYSFDSFLELTNPKLELVKYPIFHLLDECKNVLETRGLEIIDKVFKKFGRVGIEVKDIYMKHLNNVKNDTRKILETIVNCEENYIFTNDPSMLDLSALEPMKAKDMNAKIVQELRVRINNYFKIVVKNLRDTVPKILGQFLVHRFSDELEVEILNGLNRKNYCLNYFNENKTSTSQRQKLKNELQALMRAENLLVNEFGMGISIVNITKKSVEKEETNGEISDQDLLDKIETMNEDFLNFANNMANKPKTASPVKKIQQETNHTDNKKPDLNYDKPKAPEKQEATYNSRMTQQFTQEDRAAVMAAQNPANKNIKDQSAVQKPPITPQREVQSSKPTYNTDNPRETRLPSNLNNKTPPTVNFPKPSNDPYNIDFTQSNTFSSNVWPPSKPSSNQPKAPQPKSSKTNNLFGDYLK